MQLLNLRSIVITVLGVFALLSLVITIVTGSLYGPAVQVGGLVASISFTGLGYAYWRGWEQARYVALVITTALSALVNPVQTEFVPASALIAPLLALLLANPAWVAAVAAVQLIVFLIRGYLSGGATDMGTYASIAGLLIYAMAIVVMVCSRLVVDVALSAARANARRADEARAQAERQAADLARQAADLNQHNREQEQLLELVSALETPAVALADGILLAPVVGALDSRRAQALTVRLLREVSERGARHIVLDIAGVAHVDTEVAGGLVRMGQALRLLGCLVTITGISATVAANISHLGISLGDVQVARSPQDVLTINRA